MPDQDNQPDTPSPEAPEPEGQKPLDSEEHSMMHPLYEHWEKGEFSPAQRDPYAADVDTEPDVEEPQSQERMAQSPVREQATGGIEEAQPAETMGPETPTPEAMPAEAAPGEGEGAEAPPVAAEEPKAKEEKKVRYEIVDETLRQGSVVDLKFQVPYAEYDDKMQEHFKELRNTVVIAGFRKGKAPLRLIQNRYQKQVRQETLDLLFENALDQIVKAKEYDLLRLFDRVDPELSEGQDLAFAVSLEVRPKLDVAGYDHFDLTVDMVAIDEAYVEKGIERLRRRHATYQASDLLAWAPGSGVVLDITVQDDKGETIEALTKADQFLQRPEYSLPEPVVAELRSKRAGDFVVARVPNTRTSEGGVVVSQHDRYRIKVREVRREILPELNDAFAKDLGAESVEKLREGIRQELEQREERHVREDALEKIYAALLERHPFDVPERMVAQIQVQLVKDYLHRMETIGISIEELEQDPKEYIAQTHENADGLARTLTISRAIAEKEHLEPTEEDVARAIERRAQQEGRRPLAIRAHLEAQKEMDQFRDNLKYEMVDDFLLSRATISRQYVPAEGRLYIPK